MNDDLNDLDKESLISKYKHLLNTYNTLKVNSQKQLEDAYNDIDILEEEVKY